MLLNVCSREAGKQIMDIAFIPNILLYRIEADSTRIHLNVLLSNLLLIAAIGIVINFSIDMESIPHVCLFNKFFGIPCPGCGITRSLLALFIGDIHNSLIINPAGLFFGMSLFAQLPFRIAALCMEGLSKYVFKLSVVMSRFICIVLIMNWLYKIF